MKVKRIFAASTDTPGMRKQPSCASYASPAIKVPVRIQITVRRTVICTLRRPASRNLIALRAMVLSEKISMRWRAPPRGIISCTRMSKYLNLIALRAMVLSEKISMRWRAPQRGIISCTRMSKYLNLIALRAMVLSEKKREAFASLYLIKNNYSTEEAPRTSSMAASAAEPSAFEATIETLLLSYIYLVFMLFEMLSVVSPPTLVPSALRTVSV